MWDVLIKFYQKLKNNKILCYKSILIILFILLSFFFILSILFVVIESRIVPEIQLSNIIITTIFSTAFSVLLFISAYLLKQFKVVSLDALNKILLFSTLAGYLIVGLILVLNIDFIYLFDSRILLDISSSKQDYSYISRFPYQAPLTALLQILHSLVGSNYILIFSLLNILSILLIIFMIYKLTNSIFKSETTTTYSLLLISSFLPFLYYIPHIYGDIIGVSLTLTAIYLLLLFIRDNKIMLVVASICLFCLSICIKGNTNIVLIIVSLFLVAMYIFKNSFTNILLAISILIIPMVFQIFTIKIFESINNIDSSNATPKTIYIAVGLKYADRDSEDNKPQEISPGTWAPGITGGHMMNKALSLPKADAEKYIINTIKEELLIFINHPLYALNFFTQKTVATWTSQGFEGPDRLGYTIDDSHHNTIYAKNHSKTLSVFEWFTKIHQTIVYFSAILGILFVYRNMGSQKNRAEITLILMLVLFGFLFSMVWEVMSRSILLFYLLLIPLSGYGIDQISNKISTLLSSVNGKSSA